MNSPLVAVKVVVIKSALASNLFKKLSEGSISVESAQELGLSTVCDQQGLISLGHLITTLERLSKRNLNLIDSVTVPLEQLEYIESMFESAED